MSLKTFPQKSWAKIWSSKKKCQVYFIPSSVPHGGGGGAFVVCVCLAALFTVVIAPLSFTEQLLPHSMPFYGAASHDSPPFLT